MRWEAANVFFWGGNFEISRNDNYRELLAQTMIFSFMWIHEICYNGKL